MSEAVRAPEGGAGATVPPKWRDDARKAFLGHLGAEEDHEWAMVFSPRWMALDAALDVAERYLKPAPDPLAEHQALSNELHYAEEDERRIAEAVAAERERIRTVTRFEVIDHSENAKATGTAGRVLVIEAGVSVELAYQDGDRTLKVFLRDHPDLIRGDQP